MLDFIDSNNGELNFSMEISTSRKININWNNLESRLELHRQCKQIIFIDPIALSLVPELIDLELILHNVVIVPINIAEKEKNTDTLLSILSMLEHEGVGRLTDKVYAVGGGVLIDVVGLACSIFRRGIYLTKVPTTLLAFIDASIGIKTGINFLGQRNRLGSYNAKFDVLLDPNFLTNLDPSLIKEGLGEIFKIALIKSKELFGKIEESLPNLLQGDFYIQEQGKELLSYSLKLMLEELHENPEEDLLERCVDFGHTFSPLVEMESVNNDGYRKLPHGYAVAYDCLLSSSISNIRGLLSDDDFTRICNLYLGFDFNFSNPIYIDDDLMWASVVEMTKHRGNSQHIPLPTAIGEFCFIEDLTFSELKIAKNHLAKLFEL